jgi:hypothetical protein
MRSTMLSTHLRNYLLWKRIGVPKKLVDWERPQTPKLIIYLSSFVSDTMGQKFEILVKKQLIHFLSCAF